MLKLGITGGIGSGKSVVSGLFSQLGIPVFDSDREARILIDSDPKIRSALIRAFGKEIYLPPDLKEGSYGPLDRKKVGALVFKDQKALQTLNAITHPPVIQAAKDWMEQQSLVYELRKKNWRENAEKGLNPASLTAPAAYVIKEAALLFESGTNKPLDFVLGVYADKKTRLARIIQRDQLTRAAAENRMQKQMDEQKKMDLCDGVILNEGQDLLWPQVLRWHRFFQQKATELDSCPLERG